MSRQGRDQLCLATNGPGMTLPVTLIWPSPEKKDSSGPGVGKTLQIPPCGPTHGTPAAAQEEASAVQAVIIRPE